MTSDLLEGSQESQESQRGGHEIQREIRPENIRAIRLGHGGNCSSVGSVIDTLFLSAAIGGAVFAAVCAAMREEPVHVVGGRLERRALEEEEEEEEKAPDHHRRGRSKKTK